MSDRSWRERLWRQKAAPRARPIANRPQDAILPHNRAAFWKVGVRRTTENKNDVAGQKARVDFFYYLRRGWRRRAVF